MKECVLLKENDFNSFLIHILATIRKTAFNHSSAPIGSATHSKRCASRCWPRVARCSWRRQGHEYDHCHDHVHGHWLPVSVAFDLSFFTKKKTHRKHSRQMDFISPNILMNIFQMSLDDGTQSLLKLPHHIIAARTFHSCWSWDADREKQSGGEQTG